MEMLAQELTALNRTREEIERRVDEAKGKVLETQQTLSQDGSQLGELTNSVAAAQRLVKDLEAGRSAINAQQQAAKAEVNLVNQSIAQILGKIGEKLPQPRRELIQQAIDEVDRGIEEGKQKVEALRQKVTETESALAAARGRISKHEAGSREAMTELRDLPPQIQAARGQVAKLNAAVEAAATAGRMAEAFYLVGEVKRALTRLAELSESPRGNELRDRVAERWLEARAVKAEVSGKAGKAAVLDQLKRDLATAQGGLQQQAREREGKIRSALTAGESSAVGAVGEKAKPSSSASSRGPRRSGG
jgi:chromosome segregation ATPase